MKAVKLEDGTYYYPVKERLLQLRSEGHKYDILTESNYTMSSDGNITGWQVKAMLLIHSGDKQGSYTGTSYEYVLPSDKINAYNALENAETSAVGRALAMAGIGIEHSIASLEEMNRTKHVSSANKTANEMVDVLKSLELRPVIPAPEYVATTSVEVEKNPEHYENALPESLIDKMKAGVDVDGYLNTMSFDEFVAIMKKYEVPHAPRLKTDSKENRAKFIHKLKVVLQVVKEDAEESLVVKAETENYIPKIEVIPTVEEPQEEIPKSETEPIPVTEIEKEKKEVIGGTMAENYENTGNRYGIQIPLKPENGDRSFMDMSMLWKNIEKVMTFDALEKKLRKHPEYKQFVEVDDLLRSADNQAINIVLNTL